MNANVVSKSSGVTVITDGESAVLLKDMGDGGSAVDQVVMATQHVAQIFGGTIGGDKTIINGEWGDPHVRNNVFKGAANSELKQALDALQADADDNGRIDNKAGYDRVVAMISNAANAGAGGEVHEIMDLQADHVLVNGSMSIAVDVQAQNAHVAWAENAKITFADGSERTITNIWNSTGADGALGVRESRAGDGGESKGTFYVASDDEMGNIQGTHVFGKAHGSAFKYVLDVAGNYNGSYGKVGMFWPAGHAMHLSAPVLAPLEDRYGKDRKRADESSQ